MNKNAFNYCVIQSTMAKYPDECHFIFAIGMIFFGIGMIVIGVNDVNTLPDYSGCEDHFISEEYCQNSRDETAARIQNEGDTKKNIGIGVTIFAIIWGACSLSSIINKYRSNSF